MAWFLCAMVAVEQADRAGAADDQAAFSKVKKEEEGSQHPGIDTEGNVSLTILGRYRLPERPPPPPNWVSRPSDPREKKNLGEGTPSLASRSDSGSMGALEDHLTALNAWSAGSTNAFATHFAMHDDTVTFHLTVGRGERPEQPLCLHPPSGTRLTYDVAVAGSIGISVSHFERWAYPRTGGFAWATCPGIEEEVLGINDLLLDAAPLDHVLRVLANALPALPAHVSAHLEAVPAACAHPSSGADAEEQGLGGGSEDEGEEGEEGGDGGRTTEDEGVTTDDEGGGAVTGDEEGSPTDDRERGAPASAAGPAAQWQQGANTILHVAADGRLPVAQQYLQVEAGGLLKTVRDHAAKPADDEQRPHRLSNLGFGDRRVNCRKTPAHWGNLHSICGLPQGDGVDEAVAVRTFLAEKKDERDGLRDLRRLSVEECAELNARREAKAVEKARRARRRRRRRSESWAPGMRRRTLVHSSTL